MSEPRRRVLFVIGDLGRAGAETQLVRLAIGLRSRAYETGIVTLRSRNDFADELASAGVPVASLDRRSARDMHVLWRLYAQLRVAQPQVVHSFLPFPNLLCAIAASWARVPVLILSQRASYETTLSPFWRRAARWAHRRAGHVIVNSEAARREEIAAGLPAARITYVANGIEPLEPPPALERAALGLPAGPLVVCVAQFAPEKGHADLIAAWPSVRAACPAAILALVGDGALRAAIEASCARLGLESSVRLLGARNGALPYLAAADVVVLASRTEGMPNAVLEAMALGKPVVATRVGGLPELIEHGTSGWLAPAGDPEALAAGLEALLSEPQRGRALGEAAREAARTRFGVSRMLDATERVYREASSS